MNKLFRLTIITIVIAASILYFYGCSCNCGAPDTAEIPADVLRKTDAFIIEKTGRDFFGKYITVDLNRSRENENGYSMIYRLIIPEKPYVNEVIEFHTDKAGERLAGIGLRGIPDCISGTGECEFNTDEVQALAAAEKAGLPEGIKPWEASFIWDDELGRYVWYVLSTFEESAGDTFSGSGKAAMVDPSSGEVIKIKDWKVN